MQVGNSVGAPIVLGNFLFDSVEIMTLTITPACDFRTTEKFVDFIQNSLRVDNQVAAFDQ